MWARTHPLGAAKRGRVIDQLPSQHLIQGDKELQWSLRSGGPNLSAWEEQLGKINTLRVWWMNSQLTKE